jgi:hypothetical protein
MVLEAVLTDLAGRLSWEAGGGFDGCSAILKVDDVNYEFKFIQRRSSMFKTHPDLSGIISATTRFHKGSERTTRSAAAPLLGTIQHFLPCGDGVMVHQIVVFKISKTSRRWPRLPHG